MHSEGDVLLKDELIKLAEKFPSRLKIWPTVSSTPHNGNWKFGAGHVSLPRMASGLFRKALTLNQDQYPDDDTSSLQSKRWCHLPNLWPANDGRACDYS